MKASKLPFTTTVHMVLRPSESDSMRNIPDFASPNLGTPVGFVSASTPSASRPET